MEYECCRMAPAGVSIHSSRIPHTDDSEESNLHMAEVAPAAAELLAHAKVNAICFGCTGASLIKRGIDQKIIQEIEAVAKNTCDHFIHGHKRGIELPENKVCGYCLAIFRNGK